jgi:hypothetical protein
MTVVESGRVVGVSVVGGSGGPGVGASVGDGGAGAGVLVLVLVLLLASEDITPASRLPTHSS